MALNDLHWVGEGDWNLDFFLRVRVLEQLYRDLPVLSQLYLDALLVIRILKNNQRPIFDDFTL